MRGARSPGGSGSRVRGRRVYTVRRILAVLALVLLLALLIPQACQAIFGPEEGAGSRKDRGDKAPENAAGAGAADDTEETTAERADTAEGDAADKESAADDDEAREDEDAEDEDAGGGDAEKDLGEVLTSTLSASVAEPEETDQEAVPGDDASADQPAPVAPQAPADEDTGSSGTVAPVEEPPLEPAPERRARSRTGPVASGLASKRIAKPAPGPAAPPVRSVSVAKPVLDPVQVSPPERIDVAPVRAAPVAVAPVSPAPVANDTAFTAGVAPVNNAAAFRGAGAVRSVGAGAFAGAGGQFR